MEKLGSAGKAPLFCEVKLVDADGADVTEPDVKGEVCVSGPNVMKGYWNRPEATADAIDPTGWFHTGDVGYFDADGFLFIADRVKDMVITGGENVYPAEVESVLYDHPAIVEVAVIGLADERWGEAVTAVVVLKEGEDLTLDALRDFADGKLARYKLPTKLADDRRDPAQRVRQGPQARTPRPLRLTKSGARGPAPRTNSLCQEWVTTTTAMGRRARWNDRAHEP